MSQALYPNLLLPDTSFFQPNFTFKSGKRVFAHYMVCLPIFGGPGGGVPGLKQEILMAQSMGLDGFVLNCGEWSSNQNYVTVTTNMFEAAKELGTGFQLFFSIDGLDYPDIIDMMTKFGPHPNHFTNSGRPVLSTFSMEGNGAAWWSNNVLNPLKAKGINCFFVPGFGTTQGDYTPSGAAGEVAYWGDLVDGLMDWQVLNVVNNDAGTTPAQMAADVNTAYQQALAAKGKVLLAGLVNLYWGSRQPSNGRVYYEFEGGIGAETQWKGVINADVPWIEILTWNDLNESYMMPIDDPIKYNAWGQPLGWYENHRGYAELDRYYIQWFKTGVQPTITKDALFYFYRTQPYAMTASNDPEGQVTRFLGPVANNIYVTTALTSAATLTVTTGSSKSTYNLLPGIQHTRIPFSAGAQAFSLTRNGVVIASVGGQNVVTSGALADFWNTTGFVEV